MRKEDKYDVIECKECKTLGMRFEMLSDYCLDCVDKRPKDWRTHLNELLNKELENN